MIDVATDADRRNPVSSQVTPVSVVWRSCSSVGSAGITAELRIAYDSPASDRTSRISVGWTRSAWSGPGGMSLL